MVERGGVARRDLPVTRTASPPGLKLAGEIDASNVGLVEEALEAHRSNVGSLHLDLRDLEFCDVGGLRAIASFAGTPRSDRRLLLHGLPAQAEMVLNAAGWSELPGIEFCTCDLTA